MLTLIDEIDAFLTRSGMSSSTFGMEAMKDPGFVSGLRNGRDPKMSTVERVRTFIAERDKSPESDAA